MALTASAPDGGSRGFVVATVVFLALLATTAPPASAAPRACTVTNVTAGTEGRSLIQMVDAARRGDELEVEGVCSGPVVIKRDIVIRGVGHRPVVTGRDRDRVFDIRRGRTTLEGLTIRDGRAGGSGGGIRNSSVLDLDGSVVRGNAARSDGGGIANHGWLTVTDSRIRDNRAGWSGGGIATRGGEAALEFGEETTKHATVVDSDIFGNVAGMYGGGLTADGPMSLERSRVHGNRAGSGGGISVGSFDGIEVTDSEISENVARGSGGGISASYVPIRLSDTEITDNVAGRYGGGISGGDLVLRHTSITGNGAGVLGGGVATEADRHDIDAGSTITRNTPLECVDEARGPLVAYGTSSGPHEFVACARDGTTWMRTVVPRDTSALDDLAAGAGMFGPGGTLEWARAEHTATELPDGRVLVVGGGHSLAEVWDPQTEEFVRAGRLDTGYGHTATALPDGRVLVVGGTQKDRAKAAARVWDPETKGFGPAGSLMVPRYGHTATLLRDGRVLVVGGRGPNGRPLDHSELWDPDTVSFSPAGRLVKPRAGHTATALPDGRVLIVGGGRSLAEIWDSETEDFVPAGSLEPREWHTATLLTDGRVLVVGGCCDGDEEDYGAAEIWDPDRGLFGPAGYLRVPRRSHTATLLTDGRVLVAGGSGNWGDFEQLDVAEIWDPETMSFGVTDSLAETREGHTATALPDGRVLIAGGCCDDDSGEARALAEVWTTAISGGVSGG